MEAPNTAPTPTPTPTSTSTSNPQISVVIHPPSSLLPCPPSSSSPAANATKRPYSDSTMESQENYGPSVTENSELLAHTHTASTNPSPSASTTAIADSAVDTKEGDGEGDERGHNHHHGEDNTQTQGQTQTQMNPASKKRKLSPGSKEVKQQEKEAKERQRVEEKVRRDEEKKKREIEREEEKKKREVEREEERKKREEKRKVKDEEKAAREGEKRKKEDERVKKERMQMKLNSFFAKPAVPSKAPISADAPDTSANGDGIGSDGVSDYRREFPEFFLQSHTKVAPINRFERDAYALRHVREKVDSCLKSDDNGLQQKQREEPPVFRPSELFHMMPYKRRRGKQIPVKEILLKMQNQDQEGSVSVDRSSGAKTAARLQDSLRKVTMKSFKFGEDVRPPYQGTFTRPVPESAARKLSRNPFSRALPDANYGYDSEGEWEEPEEGEELDSEEEEEASEDGDDDMEGFLDDEEDHLKEGRRRPIVGDLEPVCSGLCWEGEEGDGPSHPELEAYRIETIPESVTLPIDPFSSAYWQQKPKSEQGRSTLHAFAVTTSASQATSGSGSGPGSKDAAVSDGVSQVAGGKVKRPFPPEQFQEFKEVVEGSDLTKAGLVEILKKRFPKISKDILKETLNQSAIRVGSKEAEKKWICR